MPGKICSLRTSFSLCFSPSNEKAPCIFLWCRKHTFFQSFKVRHFGWDIFFPFAKGPEAGGNAKERPHHWQETANLQLRACSQSSNGWARLLPAVQALSLRIARCLHWIMFFSMRSTERITLRWINTAFDQTPQSSTFELSRGCRIRFLYRLCLKKLRPWADGGDLCVCNRLYHKRKPLSLSLSLSLSLFFFWLQRKVSEKSMRLQVFLYSQKQNISLQTNRAMSVNCFARSHWWETGMWVTMLVEMMHFSGRESYFSILQKIVFFVFGPQMPF